MRVTIAGKEVPARGTITPPFLTFVNSLGVFFAISINAVSVVGSPPPPPLPLVRDKSPVPNPLLPADVSLLPPAALSLARFRAAEPAAAAAAAALVVVPIGRAAGRARKRSLPPELLSVEDEGSPAEEAERKAGRGRLNKRPADVSTGSRPRFALALSRIGLYSNT